MSIRKFKDHRMIRKCRICGKPTYHDVCASCKSIANADEEKRNIKPWRWHPNRYIKKTYKGDNDSEHYLART